ncbi:MAG: hypothetical protein MJZ30_11595 [Paludibacteraceae bacterium]|nr:hypothetical protein [Paludibacteraceae bacterium]
MAVNYYYAKPYGYFTSTQKNPIKGTVKKFKIYMLQANCLWAELYFFKKKDEEDGKTHNMEQFCGFFHDLKHLKECLSDGDLTNDNDFVFYADNIKGNSDVWKAIKVLAENGKKVTITNRKKAKV